MDKLIQKIANTVVANLDNTTEIGLFKGKMGLSVFLYAYAKYSGSSVYENMADQLIDEIYARIKPNISPSLIDGSAGIGCGLCYLLQNHYIEGNPDHVLRDLDKQLLNNAEAIITKESTSPTPVFSSGVYLLSRLSLCNAEQRQKRIIEMIDVGIFFMWEVVQRKNFVPKLSFLNSMFLVYYRLSKENIETENVKQLQKDLLRLSISAIEQQQYQLSDIILLRYILKLISDGDCIDYKCRLESLLLSIGIDTSNIEEWNNILWWYFVYGIYFLDYSLEDITNYVDQKMLDYSFDIDIINNQFAVLGLVLLKYDI